MILKRLDVSSAIYFVKLVLKFYGSFDVYYYNRIQYTVWVHCYYYIYILVKSSLNHLKHDWPQTRFEKNDKLNMKKKHYYFVYVALFFVMVMGDAMKKAKITGNNLIFFLGFIFYCNQTVCCCWIVAQNILHLACKLNF